MRRSVRCHLSLWWHEHLPLQLKKKWRVVSFTRKHCQSQSLLFILQSHFHLPAASRYFTSSKWPSCAASIRGVEQPSSMSAPALMRKSATSKKPPQHARVRAVSCVSSVWALMLAPTPQEANSYCHLHI